MSVRVRRAGHSDLRALIDMAAEMHRDSSFAPMRFDARHFGEFLVGLMAGGEHVVLVAERDDEVLGGVMASVVPSMFGPDLVACEHGLFVRPEHRAAGAALPLVRAYLDWAEAQGAKRVNAGNSAGMDDSRYVRLMEHCGLTKAGSLMYMTR